MMSARSVFALLLLTASAACGGRHGAGDGATQHSALEAEATPLQMQVCSSNADCGAAELCMFTEGSCGEDGQVGACYAVPEMCTMDYRPVCGCDGVTYGNACGAHAAATSVRTAGQTCDGESLFDELVPDEPN
ncbi:MAG: hypothetical protein H6700_07850 [Myxococcales bacterium]|nr:hypothetical protein [Myxococcales bacterium]MCB9521009.1 hypothetical protein [Myxococcales bacterium]MCB9531664.1 hypothetical protein [Myxococcales bacterium]